MKPSTNAPITTHIQKIVMCRSKISLLRALTPGVIFTSPQPAKSGRDAQQVINAAKILLISNI
jgi:hypothetical protein